MQNFRMIVVRCILFSKNVKRTFLSLEPLPDDFSKTLFYGNQVSYVIPLSVEFHDRRLNSLGGEKSQRNHRIGRIKASLTQLYNEITNTRINYFIAFDSFLH